MEATIKMIRDKLEAQGFSGLYCEGECGCGIDDMAPCGECSRENGEEWINGCEPGYKHVDPRSAAGDWVISPRKEPPTPEQFDRAFAACG